MGDYTGNPELDSFTDEVVLDVTHMYDKDMYIVRHIIPDMDKRNREYGQRDKPLSVEEVMSRIFAPINAEMPGVEAEWEELNDQAVDNSITPKIALKIGAIVYYYMQPNYEPGQLYLKPKERFERISDDLDLLYSLCIVKYKTRLMYGNAKNYSDIETYVITKYLENLRKSEPRRNLTFNKELSRGDKKEAIYFASEVLPDICGMLNDGYQESELRLFIQTHLISDMNTRSQREKNMDISEIVRKLTQSPDSGKEGELYELLEELGTELTPDQASELADVAYYTSQPNWPGDQKIIFSDLTTDPRLACSFCIVKYSTRLKFGNRFNHKEIENYVLEQFLRVLRQKSEFSYLFDKYLP